MENLFLGIDISKEKINICLMKGLKIAHEDEVRNTIPAISRMLKRLSKDFGDGEASLEVCAEYTGRYIYPLTCACHETGTFLWMEDPTRIKHSFGLSRGKDDVVDARRIAEYASRNSDKARAYSLPEKEIASIKILLNDRELLMADRRNQMAELFATSKQIVSHHIVNILKEGDLITDSVVKYYLTTATDSKQYNIVFYSLEMIIAVGYRV